MFLVPLSGDKIETVNGVVFTVLTYSNYKSAPVVYVQGPSTETKSISFDEIAKINTAEVKLSPGKVFIAPASVHNRKAMALPQNDDKVNLRNQWVKVKSLKLNDHGNLSAGLLIIGTDIESGKLVTVRLAELDGIEYADGTKNKNITAFKKQYRDYLGAASGANT